MEKVGYYLGAFLDKIREEYYYNICNNSFPLSTVIKQIVYHYLFSYKVPYNYLKYISLDLKILKKTKIYVDIGT